MRLLQVVIAIILSPTLSSGEEPSAMEEMELSFEYETETEILQLSMGPGPSEMLACPALQTGHSQFLGTAAGPNGPVSFTDVIYTTASVCPTESQSIFIGQYIPYFKSTEESLNKSRAFAFSNSLAAKSGPYAPVVLHIILPEVEFDFSAFAAPGADRESLLSQRTKSLAGIQDWVDEFLIEKYAAKILSHSWLVNGVDIEVAAINVASILDEPFVLDASVESEVEIVEPTGNLGWSGLDWTEATLSRQVSLTDYLPGGPNYGYLGEGPTWNSSDNIRLGWMDSTTLNCDHVSFCDDWACSTSKLIDTFQCNSSSCNSTSTVCGPPWSASKPHHSTYVGWVAAGSIEQGQDPGYQTETERRMRSGTLREMSMYFYRHDGARSFRIALEHAVATGIDVYNQSSSVSGDCDLTLDSNGYNAYLSNATLAGLIVVAPADNRAPNPDDYYGCTVAWPAVRSNVISVSGVTYRDADDDYIDVARCTSCSRGHKSVSVVGGGSKMLPLVDLIAPMGITHSALHTSDSGEDAYYVPSRWGTCGAAPIVSGIAGQTREWMEDRYWGSCAGHPSCVAVNMFVMADFYSGDVNYPHNDYYVTVSRDVGYGRAYSRLPTSDFLGNGWWWWQTGSNVIQDNETQIIPLSYGMQLPTSVEGVKVAIAWFDAAYEDIADLHVELIDTCPAGGGDPDIIKTAVPYQTMRKKLQVKDDADIHGRCLAVRIHGNAVDGNGEKYFFAAYGYSNDEALH